LAGALVFGPLLARPEFASDELSAGDLLDVVEISPNLPQFPPESVPPFGEIGGGSYQILIGNNLARGGEQ
jgi:hypothetical protein